MPETTNPLRYPGAKRSLVGYIDALLEANNLLGCTFYEPYAGSAAVGLELLQRNRIGHLVLCEKDILLYAFWHCVFHNTETLCNCFAYFDPPYYVKGSKIYRHYYTNQDHIALSQYVRGVHHLDWIISYDDAPFICGLYGDTGARYQPFFLDYTCASHVRTQGQELLISNLPLPPFPVANAAQM